MLLHYCGKLKLQIFCRYWRKSKQIAFLITSTFLIYPQILIFSVFKIANLSPYWLQINFPCLCSFTYLLWRSTCGIRNSSLQMLLQCLSTINMILSDEDKILIKSLHLKGYAAKMLTDEFPEKSWTKCGVNKLFKKLQDTGIGGQAVADRTVPALKKMLSFFFRSSRSLPPTLFCWLSGDVTENIFSSLNKTKSVAYCGNFWSRSLSRFMWAAQFASVSYCARRLLKHFRCKSL